MSIDVAYPIGEHYEGQERREGQSHERPLGSPILDAPFDYPARKDRTKCVCHDRWQHVQRGDRIRGSFRNAKV